MVKSCSAWVLLALLLISILSISFRVKPVDAWPGTVYIRADGSIDPPSAPIKAEGNIYQITAPIKSQQDGIIIEADNIIVDGAGYTLEGTGYHTGIIISNRINVTIKKLTIKNFDYGVYINYTSNINIIENCFERNWRVSIRVGNSLHVNICENVINGFLSTIANSPHGIAIRSCDNCKIFKNKISYNDLDGIQIIYSSNIIVNQNIIAHCAWGIYVHSSSKNTIYENTMTNNKDDGICLISSYNNIILTNNITKNGHGIYCYRSYNNTICHNNFIDNDSSVFSEDSNNTWDCGYPSGGNYWSDYAGIDEKGGPNQDKPGSDGIGDTPYIIDKKNRDGYPLMKLYNIPVAPPSAYILHVQSSPITGIEISYSGDYSGTGTTNFDIGPKNSPFTVTLRIPYRFGNYRLDYLKIDGKRKGAVETLTITVDDQNKESTVEAVFVPKKFDPLMDGFRFSNSEFTETVHLKLEEIKQCLKSDPVTNKIPEWLLVGLIDHYQKVQNGYCGGMTLAAKYCYENPDKLPNGCLNLIEAQKEDVLDTIVYFQNTQYFIDQYFLKWILVNLGEAPGGLLSLENQISWLKSHVDKGGVAYVDIIGRDDKGNYISHAVLAYDATDDGNKVKILVYGPNRPFESQAIELIRDGNGKLQISNGEAYVDYFWISRLAIADAPTDLDWDYIVDKCLAQLIEWLVKQFKKSVDNLVDYFSQIENTFAIKLQSAAELHIYDSTGMHVGPVEGGIHIGFPSIFYIDEDGAENFILPSPNSDDYKVLLVGKTNGHYNLTIFTIRNGALLSKIIKTGNISEGEKQEININISPSGEVKEQTKSPTDHHELWIIAGLLGIVAIITISITIIKKRKSMRHEYKPLS